MAREYQAVYDQVGMVMKEVGNATMSPVSMYRVGMLYNSDRCHDFALQVGTQLSKVVPKGYPKIMGLNSNTNSVKERLTYLDELRLGAFYWMFILGDSDSTRCATKFLYDVISKYNGVIAAHPLAKDHPISGLTKLKNPSKRFGASLYLLESPTQPITLQPQANLPLISASQIKTLPTKCQSATKHGEGPQCRNNPQKGKHYCHAHKDKHYPISAAEVVDVDGGSDVDHEEEEKEDASMHSARSAASSAETVLLEAINQQLQVLNNQQQLMGQEVFCGAPCKKDGSACRKGKNCGIQSHRIWRAQMAANASADEE